MIDMTMEDVVGKLRSSIIEDTYNFMIVLHKTKDYTYKAYQVCIEKYLDVTQVYVSEYDLEDGDVGKTWNIKEFPLYIKNATVIAISDIESF